MPLEDILKKIEEKARRSKEEILSSAKKECEKKLETAKRKAAVHEEKVIEEAEREASRIQAIAASRAESQKRQMVLREKQSLIASVFDKALEKLSTMSSDEYEELLLNMIASSAKGTEELILGPEDRARLGKDFINIANERLKNEGKRGQLRLSYSPQSLGGGFILKTGGISLNLTSPALLNVLRDELEPEVAKLLFAGTGREGG